MISCHLALENKKETEISSKSTDSNELRCCMLQVNSHEELPYIQMLY